MLRRTNVRFPSLQSVVMIVSENCEILVAINSKLHLSRVSLCFKDFAEALSATAQALLVFNDIYHDETLTTQLFVLEKRFTVSSGCYFMNNSDEQHQSESLKLSGMLSTYLTRVLTNFALV